jgi:endonuclease-3
MRDADIHQVVAILIEEIKQWIMPIVGQVAEESRSPFQVLISCVLSLRTKDATTAEASRRLFALATAPEAMLRLSTRTIEKAIYPVGFYRTKARNIKAICKDLIEKHGSRVPDSIDELLTLKGVGRKTANLVVTLGYRKLGICVDTHVHRISNRLGYVKTKTPEQTEMALREKLPRKYWIIYNDLLVTYGQNLCVPISPWCSRCRLASYCDRVGVTKNR